MACRLNGSVNIKIFQVFGNGIQEGTAERTVNNPMIIAERNIHHVADGYAVALRGFDYHRPFLDGTYRHDRNLRLVDDGGAHDAAKSTDIGQRESPAIRIIRS